MPRVYLINEEYALTNIEAVCSGCSYWAARCKFHLEEGLCRGFTCLYRMEQNAIEPRVALFPRDIDRNNPRNIKCEHCRYFEKGSGPAKKLPSGRGRCFKFNYDIEYWKKRDCFEWRAL